jgi:hypothetical protein
MRELDQMASGEGTRARSLCDLENVFKIFFSTLRFEAVAEAFDGGNAIT